MRPGPENIPGIVPDAVKQRLVCPVCKSPLEWREHLAPPSVACTACDRTYLFVDGIPILLRERATIRD